MVERRRIRSLEVRIDEKRDELERLELQKSIRDMRDRVRRRRPRRRNR